MSIGLVALLDDVAAMAKLAAASVDDIAGQAAKSAAKSAGIVIDDTAVTPGYVVGFAAERELPMIGRIALASLRNKLLILLPAALLLSAFLPGAIPLLLLIGGLYLCYEGAEKVLEAVAPHAAHAHEAVAAGVPGDPAALEDARVAGAIRTDFILSAEIMVLTLGTVAASDLLTQTAVLTLVGAALTVGVYGVVALIVKADDFGVALALRGGAAARLGRGLVRGMPHFLRALTVVGVAAMIWVGGGIVLHALAEFGASAPEHALEAAAHAAGEAVILASAAVAWVVTAAGAGAFGLAVGLAAIPAVGRVGAPAWRAVRGLIG